MDNKNKVDFDNMIGEIVIDFGSICRFCLTETDSSISILDEVPTDKIIDRRKDLIIEFVMKLTCIKTNELQNFPSLVCKNCYDIIKSSYSFSLVCQESEESLQECYQRTLDDTKAKLNINQLEDKYDNQNESKRFLFSDKNISNTASTTKISNNVGDESQNLNETEFKWKQMLRKKNSVNVLKAGSIKQKYQKITSLSDRLKEAQTKLKEDIVHSNDLTLGSVKDSASEDTSNTVSPLILGSLQYDDESNSNSGTKKDNVRKSHQKSVKGYQVKNKLIDHHKSLNNDLEFTHKNIDFLINKNLFVSKRNFICFHCTPCKTYEAKEEWLNHLKNFHEKSLYVSLKQCSEHPKSDHESESLKSVREIDTNNLKSIESKRQEESSNLNLFKIFVCTDCSPPVSFTNADVCLRHKISSHNKQPESVGSQELFTVYVDSLNVFKLGKEENFKKVFKVLCKNCNPPSEFISTNEFVKHMISQHDKSDFENWDVETEKIHEEPSAFGDGTNRQPAVKKWKCSECSSSYNRKHSLSHHMKEKHNKTLSVPSSAKCPDCGETFCTNRQLVQHGISVHQKYLAQHHKVFKKRILQLSSSSDEEGDNENKSKQFDCDICQKKYACKNSWKRHVRKAHLGKSEAEKIVCPYCGKSLSNKLNLKSHIEFVHEALFVLCPICKKRINFRTIGKHYKTHQSGNSEWTESGNQFLCNLCGKILKSKKSFEDHQKLHKNIRDQLCDVCGSGFTNKKFLHLHKKTHEGGKRKVFGCSQCEKVFSGRHTLNRHLLTHSGEKNFICEICSKCFYTLQELNRHVRYHKKEYRFDCQLCDMRFLDKSRFRHHMMRHRNVRPHKCQFCDKMFIVKRKMNLHMAAKHNVEVKNTKGVWKDPKTYVPLDDLL